MDDIVCLGIEQSPELGDLIDIKLENLNNLKEYDTVEVDIVFYPYSREITPDFYEVEPYHDHTQTNGSKASQYRKRTDPYAVWFGGFLGTLLTSIVGYKNPVNVWETESLVAIGATTFAGVKGWENIEHLLSHATKNTRTQFKENIYHYEKNLYDTLGSYVAEHQKKRYEKSLLLPQRFDLVQVGNGYVIRMEFSKDAVEKIRGNTAKIATIRIDKDKAAFIKESGCGITLKLKLGKYHNKVLLYRNELVQTLLGDQLGCLDKDNNFMPEKFELRQSVSCGRIKKYLQHAYIEGKIIEDNLQTTTNSTPPITQQSQTATPPASQTNSRVGKIVPLEQLG